MMNFTGRRGFLRHSTAIGGAVPMGILMLRSRLPRIIAILIAVFLNFDLLRGLKRITSRWPPNSALPTYP